MSYNVPELNVKKVYYPTMNQNKERWCMIPDGGSVNSYYEYSASTSSNSFITFNCTSPSPQNILDRLMFIKYRVTITLNFTKGSGGGTVRPLIDGAISLRNYPLQNVTSSLACTLNGTQASNIPCEDILSAVCRYNNSYRQRVFNDVCPTALDRAQAYATFASTSRNPLATRTDADSYELQRGAFPAVSMTNPSLADTETKDCVLVFDVVEPLIASPFVIAENELPGLFGIQNFTLQFNLASLDRMLCLGAFGADLTLNSVDITLANTIPTLLCRFITPKPDYQFDRNSNVYSLYNVDVYGTTLGNISADASLPAISANIQIGNVPNRIYIYARANNSQRSRTTSDAFCQISNLSINFDNRTGLLASCTPSGLYVMSKRNGLEDTFNEFWGDGSFAIPSGGDPAKLGLVGSVICIDPARDLGLGVNLSNGVNGTFNFSVNATLKNISASTLTAPTLYIVMVNEGAVTVSGNKAVVSTNIISQRDVMEAPHDVEFDVWHDSRELQGGGNWLTPFKNMNQVMREKRLLSRGARKVADFVEPLGYGALMGGKKMSKASLERRM